MDSPSLGSRVGIGRTAEIFAWREHQVVKLFHAGFSSEIVANEMEKSRLISALDLPTPKFIEMIDIEGRKGLVYERVSGISMLKMLNARPWLLFRLARQFAELHTAIHQQQGDGFPGIESELNTAIQWVASLPGVSPDQISQLRKQLPSGHVLCHLDFHPDQVIMTARGPIILDWMTAYQGHPLADVARTTILLKIGQVPYGGRVMQTIIGLWRRFFLETYLTRYFELNRHLEQSALVPWLIPVAVGRLNEGIAGEEEALLRVIENAFDTL
jgi:hypothetical protein